jgi:hypothetical protein
MPKRKKSKIFSLVSGYESADEKQDSNNSSQSSNDDDDDDNNNTAGDSDQNQSISHKSLSNEDKDESDENLLLITSKENSLDGQKSDLKDEIIDEDDEIINCQSAAIAAHAESLGRHHEQDDSATAVVNGGEFSCLEEASSICVLNSQYTLENGFPPGCELIRLPAEPKATCSQVLQNKIIQVTERMRDFNYSINNDIHNKKSFKNPSIYEKLIEVYGINEFGSSFPNHIEDLKSNGFMFYDELDAVQRADWAKKEKEKKERTKIEMISAIRKK